MALLLLDRLLIGSSSHRAEREGHIVLLRPQVLSDAGLANFQHIAALAQQGEWDGYRIGHIRRRGDLGGLPEAIQLKLLDS